jgi:diguanylate cyclase
VVNLDLIARLVENMLLLLGMSVLYEFGYLFVRFRFRTGPILTGLMIGFIGIVIMTHPYELSNGIVFDSRSILIGVAALQFGFVPAAVAVGIMAAFRLANDGMGALAGVAVLLSIAAIGLVARRFAKSRKVRRPLWMGYLFGVVIHVDMLLCMFLLPFPKSVEVVRAIALPVLVLYPIVTVLLNELLVHQKDRIDARQRSFEVLPRYKNIFDNDYAIMLVLEPASGRILDANQAASDFYGWSRDELVRMNIADISALTPEETLAEMQESAAEGRKSYQFRHRLADGSVRDVEVVGGPIRVHGQSELHTIVHDVTDRKRAQTALLEIETRYRKLVQSSMSGFWVTDPSGRILEVNDAYCTMIGHSRETLLNMRISDLEATETEERTQEHLEAIRRKGYEIFEGSHRKADGTVMIVQNSITFLPGQNIYLAFMNDITERRREEKQLRHVGTHDFLTDLNNRAFFESEKKRLDHPDFFPLSVLVADINGVRFINDTLGHAEGDRLIVETSDLLRRCLRSGDVCARIGGDEFSILLPRTDGPGVHARMQAIEDTVLSFNARSEVHAYEISLCLGYGSKTDPGRDLADVFREAESYMLKRKMFVRKSYRSSLLLSMMATLQERSHETEEHAGRLAGMSRTVGEKLELSARHLEELELFSMMHDIGKIGIDDRILKKPGKLTDKEWEVMRMHPEIGYRIAMSSPEFESIAESILHHHERWDGTGYPGGLRGEEIPILSRILAVTDSYDAMTQKRAYRPVPMTPEEAAAEIRRNAGTQFDPLVAATFLESLGA